MKRTIGILAHVDAGKTTLSEALLYKAGAIRKAGRVDHGDTLLDSDAMERERGITIFSKQARFNIQKRSEKEIGSSEQKALTGGTMHVTLLDTPGHVDFSAETERTLQVLDDAILVVSGTDGVQSHTRTLWRLLEHYHLPVLIFINKMDLAGADREKIMRDLRANLSENCIDFTERAGNSPSGSETDEEIALTDENLLNSFTENGALTEAEIRDAVSRRSLFPVFFGSALHMEGIEELLAGIAAYSSGDDRREAETDLEEFGARVYKIGRDAGGNRLTYMKITSGTLHVRDRIGEEKVDQIRLYSGDRYDLADTAHTGEICAVTGLSETMPGVGLGAEKSEVKPVLEAVMTCAMIVPPDTDPGSFYRKIKVLEEENPALHLTWDAAAREIRVQIMGNVEAEILTRLIKDRFGASVSFGPEHILYKETLAEPVIGIGHFEPLRHYAEVQLLMEPSDRGSGVTVDTACSEDVLAVNWQRLIMTHVLETEHPGVLTGSPLTDVRITLLAGRASTKHTEGGDFRQAVYRAIRQGLMSGKSLLLEPYYRFRLEVPEEMVGRAMSDLARMGADTEAPEFTDGQREVLKGRAPVSRIGGYDAEVRAFTKGLGTLALESDGYDVCQDAEEAVRASGYDPESDAEHPTGSVFCAHGAGVIVPWDQVPQFAHTEIRKGALLASEEILKDAGLTGFAEDSYASSNNWGRAIRKRDETADLNELDAIMKREFGVGRDGIPTEEKRDASRGNWNGTVFKYGSSRPKAQPHRKLDRRGNPIYPKKDTREDLLVVDGYNIIFQWPELKGLAEDSLDAARGKLLDILSNYQGFLGSPVTVVFDAYRTDRNPEEITKWQNLEVVFTRQDQTADSYIERLVHEKAGTYKITVATSDGLEQLTVMRLGALRMSAGMLAEEIRRVTRM